MTTHRAVVMGAGIGGLTAAAALLRAGWDTTVVERAASLEPVGSGIGIAPNAQRALDVLGVGDAVRAMAAFQGEGGLLRPSGRWIARSSIEAAARRFDGPVVVADRSAVVELLTTLLPDGRLHTGVPAQLLDPGGDTRPARVAAGPYEWEADLVVAADGIHSAARGALFPEHDGPRYAGFTAWRFVAPAPRTAFPAGETWGRGAIFGTVPLPRRRVYCYATATVPAGLKADDEQDELLRRFGTWHPPIPELISSVTSAEVLRHDVYAMEAPLPAHHVGRTALLGDAAHPMTPNLGQGGCQAIEDAIVLADRLGAGHPDTDVPAALASYTAARLPRTADVTRRSARVTRLTTWTSPPAVLLRDLALIAVSRLAPHLALRSLDGVADWRPPTSVPGRAPGTSAAG